MSKYITLSSDYHVLCLNENGEIEKQLQADDPVFEKAIGKMIESFNEAHLEQYLDDCPLRGHSSKYAWSLYTGACQMELYQRWAIPSVSGW